MSDPGTTNPSVTTPGAATGATRVSAAKAQVTGQRKTLAQQIVNAMTLSLGDDADDMREEVFNLLQTIQMDTQDDIRYLPGQLLNIHEYLAMNESWTLDGLTREGMARKVREANEVKASATNGPRQLEQQPPHFNDVTVSWEASQSEAVQSLPPTNETLQDFLVSAPSE